MDQTYSSEQFKVAKLANHPGEIGQGLVSYALLPIVLAILIGIILVFVFGGREIRYIIGGFVLIGFLTTFGKAFINWITPIAQVILTVLRIFDPKRRATVVSVHAVTQKVMKRHRSYLKRYNASVEIADTLPAAIAYERFVEEILDHLLSNAIKHAHDNNQPLKIVIDAEYDSPMIRFQVKDNGTGIAMQHHDKLFKWFFRFNPNHTPGFGIGLPTARLLARRMGGDCGIEMSATNGSVFWFTLPSA